MAGVKQTADIGRVFSYHRFSTISASPMFLLSGLIHRTAAKATLAGRIPARRSRGMMCALAVLVVSVFAGCSPMATQPEHASAEAVIALDFANIIAQIEYLPPESTILVMPSQPVTKDPFLDALSTSLQRAGFAVRHGRPSGAEHAISVKRTQVYDASRQRVETFEVNVGQVSLRRNYARTEGSLMNPVSGMQVKGLDASRLVLDNSVPDISNSQADTLAESVRNPLADAKQSENPGAVDGTVSKWQLSDPTPQGSDSNDPPKQNVYELGESNFSSRLAGYAIVHEDILNFDRESDRLTALHEAKLAVAIDLFDSELDVVSLIGCSNGPDRQPESQKVLALNRAEIVRAELLNAGLPEASILWEGCWAGETYDQRMPRSGVVLTIKRMAS